ncbi:unnamed protein product [Didymodactylos carnosus]|uniref:BZIP domain-containing protein n=1 Tax=Didymodactylos carnosus TaxID=1234261 RepID=A0A815BV76_9BILA|nr:unnamed protein product [Didymodactylos carnosus]CAF1274665.1 unnamed protein product [Didymodactylos carnosus]CAF3798778.1 unnamed protein product [Didymodactylos carnosus]CAF4065229.1 unnamed protein product [Didymodactylos carnosus]
MINCQSINIQLTLFQVQNLNGSLSTTNDPIQVEQPEPATSTFNDSFLDSLTDLETSIELPFDILDGFSDELNLENFIDTIWSDTTDSLDQVDSIDKLLAQDIASYDIENMITLQHNTENDQQQRCSNDSEVPSMIDATSLIDSHHSITQSSVYDDNSMESSNTVEENVDGGIKKLARFGNTEVVKYSNEYHHRRVKNNEAVKKCRKKAKEKQKVTENKLTKLADDNRKLHERIDLLLKELQVMKSVYKQLT